MGRMPPVFRYLGLKSCHFVGPETRTHTPVEVGHASRTRAGAGQTAQKGQFLAVSQTKPPTHKPTQCEVVQTVRRSRAAQQLVVAEKGVDVKRLRKLSGHC